MFLSSSSLPRMSQDLSEALKEATKEVHEEAENTQFMLSFQKGQVSLHEFKVSKRSWMHEGVIWGGGLPRHTLAMC